MTGTEFVEVCKSDLCHTSSRANSGQKYHNKYTEYFGRLGYAGINAKGVFTKKYSYGVVGHCCIGAQYHLHRNGMAAFVPKSPKYLFNTNVYMNWLKKEPNITGLGKVVWTSDRKKAKVGAIAFKGKAGHKNATHTCVFIKYDGDYVYTVDFNVGDGKGHNNGTLHKRHKKYFRGFANLPYPKAPAPKPTPSTTKYKVKTSGSNLNVRLSASSKSKKIASLKNGTAIEVSKFSGNWAYVPKYKGYVYKNYIKKV